MFWNRARDMPRQTPTTTWTKTVGSNRSRILPDNISDDAEMFSRGDLLQTCVPKKQDSKSQKDEINP